MTLLNAGLVFLLILVGVAGVLLLTRRRRGPPVTRADAEALQRYRAILLRADATPAARADAYLHLGEVHERLGERAKAVAMLERALEADPTLAPARELLTKLGR